MTTETYAYLKEPVLTDIFETPDNSYMLKCNVKDPTIALITWLSGMVAPGGMNSLELNIEHAKSWVVDGGAACKATLRWSEAYPDLPLHLYVEYLTTTHEGESIYQVAVQPLDE